MRFQVVRSDEEVVFDYRLSNGRLCWGMNAILSPPGEARSRCGSTGPHYRGGYCLVTNINFPFGDLNFQELADADLEWTDLVTIMNDAAI